MAKGRKCPIFLPGDLVECVDAYARPEPDPEVISLMGGLERGLVYTVRWAGFWSGPDQPEAYCVRLAEIHREAGTIHPEVVDKPYYAWRFHLVDDSRLDVFRALLAIQTVAANEDMGAAK